MSDQNNEEGEELRGSDCFLDAVEARPGFTEKLLESWALQVECVKGRGGGKTGENNV